MARHLRSPSGEGKWQDQVRLRGGPAFDAHPMNWDAMLLRMKQFLPEEDFSFDIWERDNWHRLISSKHWRLPNPESLTDTREVEHKVACSSA